ncbi:MAG: type II toxin-antitoxin system Phd/YefM family antitoxin [Gammaproteobacteria bacterium]|nr:type II toxin-antitoxin system Phd/YefM family antitoxin [Gammaproteobacteria bacterium]
MKFVTVRDLRGKTSELWKELDRERELVLTNNGKPIAILSATDEDSFESCLWTLRRSRASDALAKLQRGAEERGLTALTSEDIETEIQNARKDRKVD